MIGPVATAARGDDPTQMHVATSAVTRLILVPANRAVGQEVKVEFVAAFPPKLVYL